MLWTNTKTLMRRILLIDPLKNGFPIAKTHLLFMATFFPHFKPMRVLRRHLTYNRFVYTFTLGVKVFLRQKKSQSVLTWFYK